MFDVQLYTSLRQNAGQVAAARTETGLATGVEVCDALREVQTSLDLLDGVRADLLARLESTAGHTEEGASTSAGWTRRELRMGAGEASRNRRAGHTLQTLPKVAAALAAGRIRAAHVYEFTAGTTKLGTDVMTDLQEILLPVAESSDPAELRAMITQLHEILHPDDLDDKYARGMERRDLKATRCGTGYHVSGFLDIIAGAKFAAWLKDVSTPVYDGDDRSPAQRRVDAFCAVFEQAPTLIDQQTHRDDQTDGNGGQPETGESDAGTQPDPESEAGAPEPSRRRTRRPDSRLLVLADLETLLRLPGAQPATLAGFGHIGQRLLGYLTCGSDTTGILTHGLTDGPIPQADVLSVGRTHRLATSRQRDAVLARQGGHCANPGCGSTYLEIHHVAWWDRDTGPTDLSNLIGICRNCHHLVHQLKLTIRPDESGGFTFARQTGRPIDDHARVTKQRTRQLIATLRHTTAEQNETAEQPETVDRRRDNNAGSVQSAQAHRLATYGIHLKRMRWPDLSAPVPPDRN